MSSNIIGPFPKESGNTSENVRETSGDLDDTKKSFVFTTETVDKEWNTDMVDKNGEKPCVVKEDITPLISEKIRLTQSTEQRNHKHTIKQ